MPATSGTENASLYSSLLRIHCFGIFQVIRPEETEAVGTASKHKMWSLFKYLINHKGIPIGTQKIVNLFWPDNENPDDTATLRITISRLKSTLEPKSMTYQKSAYLIYSKDSCAFNTNSPFWLDTDEFEKLCVAAHKLGESMRKMAIDLYFQALDLYRGEFLAEDADYEWTIVPREHYRRIFQESALELGSWLLEMKDFTRAIGFLQKALKTEPYAETLQILLMKAWIEIGDFQAAAKHYSECSSLLYQELGIKPSAEWKLLYQQIKEAQGTATYQLILSGKLDPVPLNFGPMVCDPDLFWNFLLFEQRRIARNGGESSMVIIELIAVKDNPHLTPEYPFKKLELAIGRKLRKCDLVCRLDDQHLALLLQDTGSEGSQTVIAQINKYLFERPDNSGLNLQIKAKRIKL